jgi:hypothetical protein
MRIPVISVCYQNYSNEVVLSGDGHWKGGGGGLLKDDSGSVDVQQRGYIMAVHKQFHIQK